LTQKELIERFVAKYNEKQGSHYVITRYPDEENRETRDIDALAEEKNKSALAIEHTRVQTFANEKLDSSRFIKICGQLESELKDAFDGDVSMTIQTFAIHPGTDWDGTRKSLRTWLLANVPNLPWDHMGTHHVDGVPFVISLEKLESQIRLFTVSRFAPPGYKSELIEMMKAALVNKNEQLEKYRQQYAQTVLLMESEDLALVSWSILYMGFLQAAEAVSTPNIDQVWLARTSGDSSWIRCFHAAEAIMAAANPPNALFSPKYSDYWKRGIKEVYR
jgi:hypothetical protein